MTLSFAELGFAPAVTEKSTTPAADGYDGVLSGYPYHIDPTATPDAYAALVEAIAADEVTVIAYVSQVVTLAQAQATQSAALTTSYDAAIQAAVSFSTTAGVTKNFQADSNSQSTLLLAVTGYNLAGSVPTGFYWKSSDNVEVPFTLADLKGLYAAMLAQGWVAFQRLQTLKTQVLAAPTVAAAQGVVWTT